MDPNFYSYLSLDEIFQAVKRQKLGTILENLMFYLKIKVPLKSGFVSVQYLRKNHTS